MPAPASNRLARIYFWPVYFFVERVRFARSLLLLLLLIPDAYVAYLLVSQTTKDVEFSAKESRGVEYITAARSLLTSVQRLRVVGSPGLGDPALAGEVASLTVRIDNQVGELEAIDRRLGGELATTATVNQIRDQWAALKGKPPAAGARDAAFAALEAKITGDLIVNQAGNNSNLILDPDLDSYWMMDAYVFKLPTLGEQVAGIATAALSALEDKAVSNDERIDIANSLGLLISTTGDLVNVDLKTALEDNEKYNEGRDGNRALRPALEVPFTTTAGKLNEFATVVRSKLLLPAQPSATAKEIVDLASSLINEVDGLQTKVGPQLKRLCDERAERYRTTRLRGIIVFLVAALLISYVFQGFTSKVKQSQDELEAEHEALQKDILGMLDVVSQAADGDLTVRAKVTEGALGNVADAFNQMMESLQSLVRAITVQLDRSTQAVNELGQAAATMSQGATRQAEALLAASGAVVRVGEGIGKVSDNADNAAGAARRTQESAAAGSATVEDVIHGMDSLRSLVQAGAKKIKTLGDRSMEITSIVGTIAKISEQTNMLALNAAIEAARAGDQGRGFSVVADEVRKLAERTANATQEIDKLVRSIQAETGESVSAIERQTQVVEEEGQRVAAAGSALGRIREVSDQSTGLVQDIAQIARGQVSDAQQAVETMQRVSAIAQDTEKQAQGSLSIARDLGALSEELRRNVGRFTIG